jgi:hypothetical protein
MTEHWDAIVTDLWDDGDTFTAELRREGSPDLVADFSMRECQVTVQRGDLLIVTPDSVVKREPRVWTQAELDDIRRRARIMAARLGFLAD